MGQLYEQQPSPSVPLPDDRLGRALGTNKPIVSPPLPTGPKPATPAFPTPEQLTTDPSLISKFGAAKTTDLPALQQEQLDLAGRSAQAEKESTVLTGENTARQEKARTQLLQESQQRDKALKEEHQKGLQEVSPFAPTKETATDLAGLFSLLTVATMGSGGAGRYKGMATLASLTGAMKGYNEGRKELFNKDIKNFEENLKSIQSHNDKINKLYQDGMDSLSKNQELGEQKIKEAAALDNNGVIKKLADMHMYDKMGVAINTVIKALQQAQDKIDARKLEFEKISTQFANQKKLREEEAKNKPPELYRAADGKIYVWDRAKQQFAPAENAPEGLAKVGAGTTRRDEKALQAIGPALRTIAEQYPDGTAEKLVGASTEDKKRITYAYRALENSEETADFIARNPGAVGAMAVVKNYLKIDAINSIKNQDEVAAATEKSQLVDAAIDKAVANKKISIKDAQDAKILQKKLFNLALTDVQGSGQRGSIYLDKQFQNLYDQASRGDTLLKIVKERAKENNGNLKIYKLNVERHDNPEQFPLLESESVEKYMKDRAPVTTKTPTTEHIKMLKESPDALTRKHFDEAYGEGAAKKVLGN